MTQQAGLHAADSALDAAEAASPVEAVETVTRELGRALGATKVSFLIADLSGRALVRLAHIELSTPDGTGLRVPARPEERRVLKESATVLPFDGGPAEQTIRIQQVQVVGPEPTRAASDGGGQWLVLAPVTERGEAIGVLELTVPARPDAADLTEIARLANVLAFVVIANRRHTDLYEWGQRTRPLSLSAEIQHRLLPGPQTCEAGSFTLAGWLEPAADIAGDTFDFNLARNVLHLSLTDAMGHGVAAALTATLCVGSLRNARNAGASLLEQVTSANQALVDHAAATGLDDFVTGLIGRVDLRTGSAELVNAGHVAPYLVRESRPVPLSLSVHLPLGLFGDTTYRASRVDLQPGDRLVLVTDGMVERNAVGLDLAAAIIETRALHPREAVRELADRVLEETGNKLSDDATILCLDWHGGHGRDRNSQHGADPERVSAPLA
ncbi:serine/threonine-protein phosphatase [Nocardioides panacis]|uniref:Serine/threonine-protein phosphatase n=1 Tax=Nocardioides panacis TaxID=2849501 RepID=A0A975T271_9ACTN|nr:PP2C family protein-serine/threonine phosphatase [Nocardioides panacis]QWZ10181.1 serine/threonine-protein phosphatase [Nocardioides panacis]